MALFALALLFLLPFQIALPFGDGVALPAARLGALILFGWWAAHSLVQGTLRLPPLRLVAPLVAFLAFSGLSLLWAESPGLGLRRVLFLLNVFLSAFVWWTLSSRGKARELAAATVGGAALAALAALLLFAAQFIWGVGPTFHFLVDTVLPNFLGPELAAAVATYPSLMVNIGGETILRATAFFPDPHVASFFFGLSAFIALGLFQERRERHWLVCASLLFFADLLTFSRGGYLGLIAGGVTYLVLMWPDLRNLFRPGAVIALSGALLLFALAGQPIASRFISSFTLADASSTDRIALWGTAVDTILDRPFLGTGIGNYAASVLPTADARTPYYAHNLYLDVAAETGLIGLLIFLSLLFAPLSSAWRSARRGNRRAAAIVAALVLYLTHSFFETALFSLHVSLVLSLLLALGAFREERATHPVQPNSL
jgi:O-antigen ligase